MTLKPNKFSSFFKDNSLTIVLFGLFALFLVGLSITGFYEYNAELKTDLQPQISFFAYLTSNHFGEAIFENWESEFLQMWALVVLTIFLRQKGSSEADKEAGKGSINTTSRYHMIAKKRTFRGEEKAVLSVLYAHSLGLVLLCLFFLAFVLHLIMSHRVFNEAAKIHHEKILTMAQYIISPQFWFESFQNWQSEFLSVGVLLFLTIYLRERGSPESKPVGGAK